MLHRLSDLCDFIANQFVCDYVRFGIWACIDWVILVISLLINLFATDLVYDIDLVARVHLVPEVCSAARDFDGSMRNQFVCDQFNLRH
jgi:hypothetical protein